MTYAARSRVAHLGALSLVTFAVLTSLAHHARPQSLPQEEWTIEVDVQVDAGDAVPMYRQQHFPSEQACEDYVLTDDFKAELTQLAAAIRQEHPDANVIGLSKLDCIKVPDDGDPA